MVIVNSGSDAFVVGKFHSFIATRQAQRELLAPGIP